MVAPVFHARSLTELVALRAEKQADEPFVHTGAPEFGDELLTLTYADVQRAVDRLAAHYAALGLQPAPAGSGTGDDEPPEPPERVIAVLVSTAVDESLLEIALAKLGLTSLLLSVNNSAEAVAHLCRETGATHLIHGPKYARVAAEAARILATDSPAASPPAANGASSSSALTSGCANGTGGTGGTGGGLTLVPDRRFPLWGPGGVRSAKIAPYPARLAPEQEARRTCVILHSSGSTGFPKPVFVTHYGMVANAAVSVPKTGFSALPLYHGFGHFSIFRCLYHGKAFTLLPPHWPITAANIVRCIECSPTPPVQHFAVPYVLKLLAESAAGVASLASMEAVSFAGAAVPDELGDRLVAAGVPLYSQYGTTETGALLTSRRAFAEDRAWNWLRVEGLIAAYLDLVPRGGGTFEAVVRDGWPGKVMSNRADGAYCTKDLFVRHPQHAHWVKYVGRMDDTLTLTLGEKTNPVPIELDIRGNSPLIQECIVFGDGRPQVGALLLPSAAGAALSGDRAAFLRAVWPVIAAANARAPRHSRLLPEMVELLPPGTDVPVATKMSILRPACYRRFAREIDAVYARFEGSAGGAGGAAAPKRQITDQAAMESYLLALLGRTLGDRADGIGRDTDLFAHGVDSLQATRVRNAVQNEVALQGTLGQNVVYEHASVARLAAHVLALALPSSAPPAAPDVHAEMEAMAARWAGRVAPAVRGTLPAPAHATVVVTGATGSLGAHAVASLLRRPGVRVVCLSRAASDAESRARLAASFARRRLAPDWARLESRAADLGAADLGLGRGYARVRDAATAVLHLAWPVNFAAALGSFEPALAGAAHLVSLARRSPRTAKPAFWLASSVGAAQAQPGPVVRERLSARPQDAGATGYARSKWVAEALVARACAGSEGEAGVRGTVLRIGQLVGDSAHGVWNESEAWPLLFRSAGALGALPALDERVGWLPVDIAAEAIAEAVLGPVSGAGPEPGDADADADAGTDADAGADTDAGADADAAPRVLHIVNRHTAPFGAVLDALRAAGVRFDAVPRRAWLERLAASDPDVARNPTRKLLPFYEARLGGEHEAPHPRFDTRRAEHACPALRGLAPVDAALVRKWVHAWTESGFLPGLPAPAPSPEQNGHGLGH